MTHAQFCTRRACRNLLCLLSVLLLLAACAPARNKPSAPDIRVSGSWEIGASKHKGF